jgi:hypothetical protein
LFVFGVAQRSKANTQQLLHIGGANIFLLNSTSISVNQSRSGGSSSAECLLYAGSNAPTLRMGATAPALQY